MQLCKGCHLRWVFLVLIFVGVTNCDDEFYFAVATKLGGVGDKLASTSGCLFSPNDLVLDLDGNLFIADTGNNRIRKVFHNNTISTIAGIGLPPNNAGFSGDGESSFFSLLSSPSALSLGENGSLYVADRNNHRIREIFLNFTISTIAGNGVQGYNGDNLPAIAASLNSPSGIAFHNGALFIADTGNHRIRKVYSGVIATVAGTGTPGYDGDKILASSSRLSSPYGVFVTPLGEIFIADSGNDMIRKILPDFTLKTIIDSLHTPTRVFVNSSGTLFISDTLHNQILIFASDSTPISIIGAKSSSRHAEEFNGPMGIILDSQGDILVADSGNHKIKRVQISSNSVSTFAGSGNFHYCGDGGAAKQARLWAPRGLTFSPTALFIADTKNNVIRKINVNRTISSIGNNLSLNQPFTMKVESSENLLIADTYNHRILRVFQNESFVVAAGTGDYGFSGDGSNATLAKLGLPTGLVTLSDGSFYIADSAFHVIRKVLANGTIVTIAGDGTPGKDGDEGPASKARLDTPVSIFLDPSMNLFIADSNNHKIRMISVDGIITTIVGTGVAGFSGDKGLAVKAQLQTPIDVAKSPLTDELFIVDYDNHRIRMVDTEGIIRSIAGQGVPGFAVADGVATAEKLSFPTAVAIDKFSNVWISDSGNNQVRAMCKKLDVSSLNNDFFPDTQVVPVQLLWFLMVIGVLALLGFGLVFLSVRLRRGEEGAVLA